jgi:uncharacterized membrane protein
LNAENKRIILKTLSWRILATSTSMLFVYILTGQLTFAVSLGLFEIAARTALYFLHEKLWNRISI